MAMIAGIRAGATTRAQLFLSILRVVSTMLRLAGLIRLGLVLALAAPAFNLPAAAQPTAPPGGFAGQAAGAKPGEDPVVAKVNGDPTYRSDLAGAAQQLPQQYQQMSKEVL